MKVILAKTYGFCPGVERAIAIALKEKRKKKKEKLSVLKEIVHNPQVMNDLGIPSVKTLDEATDHSTVVFSAHGVAPAVYQQAQSKSLKIIDATCPLVTKVHLLVKNFVNKGYQIIYLGDPEHDEAVGVFGEAPEKILLISTKQSIGQLVHRIEQIAKKIENPNRTVVLTQTTLGFDETREIVDLLKKKIPGLLVFNTICQATTERQTAVKELAEKVELIVVVGGKNSANSQRLVKVACQAGKPAYLVTEAEELKESWFKGFKKVGVTAGASTPEKATEEVVKKLKTL